MTPTIKQFIYSMKLRWAILFGGFAIILLIGQKEIFAQSYSGNFKFEGRNRVYEVYLPQNFKPNMPLVISLHGFLESIEWYKTYTLLHEIADTAGFITVYPAAIDKSWNSGLISPGWPEIDSTINDVGFISALIDTLKAHYDIDMSRVYCCGFSLGGEMTYKLAGELGYRFAAFASITGLLNNNSAITCKPVRAFPILHMHGTLDGIETWSGDNKNLWTVPETLNFWFENNGCSDPGDTVSLADIDPDDGCTVEKISYTNCSGEGRLIFYKILNGGHSWPGSTFSFTLEGNKNMDINANVEILNFFKQFENPLMDMVYAKSLDVSPFLIQAQTDTILITTVLNNPDKHKASVLAIIEGVQSNFADTLQLFDDGVHSDGDSADNLWGNIRISTGLPEDEFTVNLITYDSIRDTRLGFVSPGRILSLGPIELNGYSIAPDKLFCTDTVPIAGGCLNLKLNLKNNSPKATATNLDAKIMSLDSLASFAYSISGFEDIMAGETSESKDRIQMWISEECPDGQEIPIEVIISSYGTVCWRDTFSISVQSTGLVINDNRIPKTTIYPNPTNNQLTIEAEYADHYSIEIISLNGQQILMGEMEGTTNQIDLSSFRKGVYFITIRSKDFVVTEKIIKL